MLYVKQRMLGVILLGFSFGVSSNQEIVTTKGIGVAESMTQACEIALDNARREAAQTALSMVKSTYTSLETNKGVSAQSDTIVTSKAFARLIEKEEEVSLNPKTGHITCLVTAKFKAGFILNEESELNSNTPINANKKTSPINNQIAQQSTQNSTAFKAGKPYCSKIMNMCFREIYSRQHDVFGVQMVYTAESVMHQHDDFMLIVGYYDKEVDSQPQGINYQELAKSTIKNAEEVGEREAFMQLFAQIDQMIENPVKTKPITTIETLKELIQQAYKKNPNYIELRVQAYCWTDTHGFSQCGNRNVKHPKEFKLYGRISQAKITRLTTPPKITETYLKELDERMALFDVIPE